MNSFVKPIRVVDDYLAYALVEFYSPNDYSVTFPDLYTMTDAEGFAYLDVNRLIGLGLTHVRMVTIGGSEVSSGIAFDGSMSAILPLQSETLVVSILTTIVEQQYVPDSTPRNLM